MESTTFLFLHFCLIFEEKHDAYIKSSIWKAKMQKKNKWMPDMKQDYEETVTVRFVEPDQVCGEFK